MSWKTNLNVAYEIEVRDKHGKLLNKQKGVSKSLLKNFLLFFKGLVHGNERTKWVTILDRNNVAQGFPYLHQLESYIMHLMADAGVDTYGLLVGSGDAEVTVDDVDLDEPISHGTGAGQLVYNATSEEDVETSGLESSVRYTRTFTNNSGAMVTVKEIGIAFEHKPYGAEAWHALVCRDVLPSPTSIPDGATFTLRYTFKVTA